MPNGVSDWLAIISVASIFLFGGGGVVAWMKQRRDSKNGVRQESRADNDSLNAQAIAIVENQFNYLVKPLTEKVDGLETKIKDLEAQVDKMTSKYWKAISFIRTLYAWIAKHMPSDVETTLVPAPPTELVDDI